MIFIDSYEYNASHFSLCVVLYMMKEMKNSRSFSTCQNCTQMAFLSRLQMMNDEFASERNTSTEDVSRFFMTTFLDISYTV